MRNDTCEICGKAGLVDNKCRLCGVEKRIIRDLLTWIRDGKILKCFQLEKEAFIQMARGQGIPEEEWPEEYRGDKIE